MRNLKYFLVKNKMMVIITSIVLVCAIAIAIGVYAQVTNRGVIKAEKKENKEYEDLESNFDDIFTNTINKAENAKQDINYDEIIYCAYNINEEKNNYIVNAKIPLFKIENDVTKQVNKEIYDTFAATIVNIAKNSGAAHTTFNLDYVVYVNNNILSLVIRCKYKDGSNPQRYIIQTYNYDIDNNKLVDINEILEYKNLNKDDVEKKVEDKIKEENAQMKSISEQGYPVYIRNENDEIYKVENTPNYFLGENNYLYLVYAYGNNNFTSDKDLVIF